MLKAVINSLSVHRAFVLKKLSTHKASHHDVVRLEVLMHDTLAVHVSEAFTHAIDNGDYDRLC